MNAYQQATDEVTRRMEQQGGRIRVSEVIGIARSFGGIDHSLISDVRLFVECVLDGRVLDPHREWYVADALNECFGGRKRRAS